MGSGTGLHGHHTSWMLGYEFHKPAAGKFLSVNHLPVGAGTMHLKNVLC